MKMKSKYMLMIGLCLVCSSPVLQVRAQSSNSTSGGFMSQFNSWINRLRGNNHNNNNNNNNNSDKDKDQQQNNGQQTPSQQQMTPNIQYSVMPYPIMTPMSGMSGMSGMYSPMSPMAMSFAPRPMPSAFGPGMPFGSMAAGSSLGPNMGPSMALGSSLGSGLSAGMASSLGSSMASGLGSSMASSLASPMASAMSSSYPGLSQLNSMRPSYSSASHMMPVHHDYSNDHNDFSGYGGYSGLSSNSYGGLGSAGADHPISDSSYNGENVEQNNNEEFSQGFSARNLIN